MVLLQFIVLIAFILLGARLGGIGIGFAGGAGVLALGLTGAKPGDLPMMVIVFIMVVIYAASAMQAAGGVQYLVDLTERFLRAHPKHLNVLAPLVTYVLTLMASTGQVSFATMPVIVEVAKENNLKPTRALSVGVAGSLLGVIASPISAAVVFLSTELESRNTGWTYLDLLIVTIPATLLGTLLTAIGFLLWDRARNQGTLWDEATYQEYLAERGPRKQRIIPRYGRRSVIIFVVSLVVILAYSILISKELGIVPDPPLTGAEARISGMLVAAGAILVACKVTPGDISRSSIFRTGMNACASILGVAWLGTTFMVNNQEWISENLGGVLSAHAWLFAIVVTIASALLYSQAAATKALFPTALAVGVSPATVVASFAATSALFILPTYPTLLAACELDTTGSTKVGRHMFDHPFLIPGLCTIVISVLIATGLTAIVH